MIWTPPKRRIITPADLVVERENRLRIMNLAHLKKASDGHLLKTSTGHLSNDCSGSPPPPTCFKLCNCCFASDSYVELTWTLDLSSDTGGYCCPTIAGYNASGDTAILPHIGGANFFVGDGAGGGDFLLVQWDGACPGDGYPWNFAFKHDTGESSCTIQGIAVESSWYDTFSDTVGNCCGLSGAEMHLNGGCQWTSGETITFATDALTVSIAVKNNRCCYCHVDSSASCVVSDHDYAAACPDVGGMSGTWWAPCTNFDGNEADCDEAEGF